MKLSLSKSEIQKLCKQRPGLVTRFFVIKAASSVSRENQDNRLAFGFSRKSGPAVQRNKMKRRFRELFRTSGTKGLDVMVLAKKSFMDLESQVWQRESAKIRQWCENIK